MKKNEKEIASRVVDRVTRAVDILTYDLHVPYDIADDSLAMIHEFIQAAELAQKTEEGKIEFYTRVALLTATLRSANIIVNRRVVFKLPLVNIWVAVSKQKLDASSYGKLLNLIKSFIRKYIKKEEDKDIGKCTVY